MASGAKDPQRFLGDINKFSEVTGIAVTTVVRKIALDLYARITKRTPVDTGRARAAWQLTINAPGEYVPPVGSKTPPEMPDLTALQLGDIVYIVNNVKYIIYLEEGSSKQAPAGMVAISMAEVKTELDAIIKANTPDDGGNT